MKWIHTADLHCNKTRLKECLEVLCKIKEFIIKKTDKEGPPLLLISGDFWDSTITNTEASGFVDYLRIIKDISLLTDVYMIYGTPSHEPAGSLYCFELAGVNVIDKPAIISKEKYTIYAIPQPRRSDFSASTEEQLNKKIISYLKNEFDIFKKHKSEHNPKISIFMYHGEISYSTYQNGKKVEESSTDALPASWIKEMNFTYTAAGHVHLPQKIKEAGECYYSGSVYQIDWGEKDFSPSFNFVEV